MIITASHSVDDDRTVLTAHIMKDSNHPFIVHIAGGSFLHMSHKQASALHLELTAALNEYEEQS